MAKRVICAVLCLSFLVLGLQPALAITRQQLLQEETYYQGELDRVRSAFVSYILDNPWPSAAVLAGGGSLAAQLDGVIDQDTKDILNGFIVISGAYCLCNFSKCAAVGTKITSFIAQIEGIQSKLDAVRQQIASFESTPPPVQTQPVYVAESSFCLKPVISGEWKRLDREQARAVISKFKSRKRGEFKATFPDPPKVRALAAPFYLGATLYEAEVQAVDGEKGLVSFIFHEGGILLLTGVSQSLHDTNKKIDLFLNRPNQAKAYLQLFHCAIQGEGGIFRIIEHENDLHWQDNAGRQVKNRIKNKIRPISIKKKDDHSWTADVTVLYSNALFTASMTIDKTGMVVMDDDTPIEADLPLYQEKYIDGVRVLK